MGDTVVVVNACLNVCALCVDYIHKCTFRSFMWTDVTCCSREGNVVEKDTSSNFTPAHPQSGV